MNTKTEIEQQVESWKQAVISQDIEQIMPFYADDIRSFDAISELQFNDRKQYEAHWQRCLQMCKMTQFEIGQLDIKVDGNLAVCFSLINVAVLMKKLVKNRLVGFVALRCIKNMTANG